MATTWIVAADSSRARVLQVMDRERRLVEIADLTNTAGRSEDKELITDAHPRFSGHGGVGKPGTRPTSGPGSDREEPSAVDHANELFSKQIGRFLDKARMEHRYDRLFLIAPPRFLGLLRKQLSKEVEKLVRDEIGKDLSWFDAEDIDRFLKGPGTAVKYP